MGGVLLGPGSLVKAITNLYDPSQTYAAGDYCTYDGRLYKCSTAITTAEQWTPAHWTETRVTNELSAAAQLLTVVNGALCVTYDDGE